MDITDIMTQHESFQTTSKAISLAETLQTLLEERGKMAKNEETMLRRVIKDKDERLSSDRNELFKARDEIWRLMAENDQLKDENRRLREASELQSLPKTVRFTCEEPPKSSEDVFKPLEDDSKSSEDAFKPLEDAVVVSQPTSMILSDGNDFVKGDKVRVRETQNVQPRIEPDEELIIESSDVFDGYTYYSVYGSDSKWYVGKYIQSVWVLEGDLVRIDEEVKEDEEDVMEEKRPSCVTLTKPKVQLGGVTLTKVTEEKKQMSSSSSSWKRLSPTVTSVPPVVETEVVVTSVPPVVETEVVPTEVVETEVKDPYQLTFAEKMAMFKRK